VEPRARRKNLASAKKADEYGGVVNRSVGLNPIFPKHRSDRIKDPGNSRGKSSTNTIRRRKIRIQLIVMAEKQIECEHRQGFINGIFDQGCISLRLPNSIDDRPVSGFDRTGSQIAVPRRRSGPGSAGRSCVERWADVHSNTPGTWNGGMTPNLHLVEPDQSLQ
jgi:hypothetical protein